MPGHVGSVHRETMRHTVTVSVSVCQNSHSQSCQPPNSLNGGYIGDCMGTVLGVIKGDTRSLDYPSMSQPYSVKPMVGYKIL